MPFIIHKDVPFLNIILSIGKILITIFQKKLFKKIYFMINIYSYIFMLLIIPSKEHDTPNTNHEFCCYF